MELYNPVGKSEGMASCATAEAYSFAKPVFLLTVLLHFNAGKTQLKFEIVFVFFFLLLSYSESEENKCSSTLFQKYCLTHDNCHHHSEIMMR